jgi:hypothetical protein
MHQIIAPIGDMHFGKKSLNTNTILCRIKQGWCLFWNPNKTPCHNSKWTGQYIMFKNGEWKAYFKCLFAHEEDKRTWLHPSTQENKMGIIEGYDAKYCKIITELEYGIQMGL